MISGDACKEDRGGGGGGAAAAEDEGGLEEVEDEDVEAAEGGRRSGGNPEGVEPLTIWSMLDEVIAKDQRLKRRQEKKRGTSSTAFTANALHDMDTEEKERERERERKRKRKRKGKGRDEKTEGTRTEILALYIPVLWLDCLDYAPVVVHMRLSIPIIESL